MELLRKQVNFVYKYTRKIYIDRYDISTLMAMESEKPLNIFDTLNK